MGVRKDSKLDEKSLWEYALRVLARRAHSAGELRQKLLRRAASAADVSATLTKLREYGLADDRKFSETFASSRLQNSGFGRFRVLRELRAKRVAPAVAEKAVGNVFADTSEEQLIEQFLNRKYRTRNLTEFLQDNKNLASVYRRLRTAGFSSGAAMAALKRHSRRAEDWTEPEEGE